MLSRLFIQNYAIIDELEIIFSGKMNVITGETGAGKSIIAGALGLILGERADTSVLVNKERKCVVEGVFAAEKKKPVQEFLVENELDPSEELVIRREIAVNGKSRAFINDTPVNLSQLGELSSLLVDLHQQFDTLELAGKDFQRAVIDAMAGNTSLLDDYRQFYFSFQQVNKELDALKEKQSRFEKEADYNRFQFNELEEASFGENEIEEAEAELKLLNNSEDIRNALNKAAYELNEGETPLVQQLKQISNQLSSFASYYPELEALVKRIQSTQLELQDISGGLEQVNRRINFDPARVELLCERISSGFKLMKKHGVNSTAELLQIQKDLEEKLRAVFDIDESIREKEKEKEKFMRKAMEVAKEVSALRKKQVKPLEGSVNKLLVQVGMPNASIKVQVNEIMELKQSGINEIEFLFDANLPAGQAGLPAGQAGKSGLWQPLRKVASGGELSRLMLCIKSLVAKSIDLPTLIFDEIDTGISGEAARQVGMIMKELAMKRQVISITHQPQIAGKADEHFFVYKEIVKDLVRTNIRKLNPEERIATIARMLSGEKPTAAAMANAREMLN